jgi:hypothetical protein
VLDRLRRGTRRAPAVVCRRGAPRPFRPVTPPRLRLTGTLRRTGPRVWTGAVTSDRLGRGRLVLRGPLLFRDFPVRRAMGVQLQLAHGGLRGWIDVRTASTRARHHRWDGIGVVRRASPQLRRYRTASLRFRGVTDDREPDRVRGRLVTDTPTGLR